MSKRERSEEKEPIRVSASLIERSNRKFQSYIFGWLDSIREQPIERPSSRPQDSGCLPLLIQSASSPHVPPVACRTGVVFDEHMLEHISTDKSDFERPARLSKTVDHLKAVGLWTLFHPLQSKRARTKELLLVHTQEHIDYVDQLDFYVGLKDVKSSSVGQDLYASEGTSRASRLACGSVIEAARHVIEGDVCNAFAFVRPPGHHADASSPSGFCFYNNVAVAARYAQNRMASADVPKPRILILDWDVHHCDGTEKIFYEDPTVLVISIHQHGNGRGHILRKMPSVKTHEVNPGKTEELDLSAVCRLMDDEPPDAPHIENTAQSSAVKEPEEDTLGILPREGRRVREAVNYNLLEQELHITDDAAAMAALGVREEAKKHVGKGGSGGRGGGVLSSNSSSSSDDDSSSSSCGSGNLSRRHLGQAESVGLSQDSFEDAKRTEGEEPFYPGTGFLDRVGGQANKEAAGRNVNIPWPTHGMGDVEYARVLQEIILPVALEFAPELVFVSCGFDSARGDTLGSMALSPSGFYLMTKMLCSHFPKLVVALEGGYNSTNVALCSEAVSRALLEASSASVNRATLPPSRMLWCQTGTLIEQIRRVHAPFWSCMAAGP